MSVVVEITNTANLKRAKTLLGAKSDGETLELALEKVIEVYEPKPHKPEQQDLPESYWEELFAQPMLPSEVIIKAISDERNEDRF